MAQKKSKAATLTQAKRTKVVRAARLSVVRHEVDVPPAVGTPDIPSGFEAPSAATTRSFTRIADTQVEAAARIATELKEAADYADDFGPYMPDAAVIAEEITRSVGWSVELRRAEAWRDYVIAEKGAAWTATLKDVRVLEEAYERAVAVEPSLATKYPALAAFVETRKAIAGRATVTRRKEKKGTTTGAASATPTTAPTKPA